MGMGGLLNGNQVRPKKRPEEKEKRGNRKKAASIQRKAIQYSGREGLHLRNRVKVTKRHKT